MPPSSASHGPVTVLFEDNHLLVVNKPTGLPTQGAREGQPGLVSWARDYLKRKYAKPGNVYIGVVSRLDEAVSGVVVLARTSKAAARLTEQFRGRNVRKVYWALAMGGPAAAVELCDWLRKDEAAGRMVVIDEQARGAQEARLRCRPLGTVGRAQWLEIELVTGRKHQIRVQLASRGWGILGDRKYGNSARFPAGIALHARSLELDHPTQRDRRIFVAPVPSAWGAWGFAEPPSPAPGG